MSEKKTTLPPHLPPHVKAAMQDAGIEEPDEAFLKKMQKAHQQQVIAEYIVDSMVHQCDHRAELLTMFTGIVLELDRYDGLDAINLLDTAKKVITTVREHVEKEGGAPSTPPPGWQELFKA